MRLEVPLEGTCAEAGIEAPFDDGVHGRIGQLNLQLAAFQAAVQIVDHEADDAADFLAGQRLVIHDLVNPVQEFGTEVGLQQTVHGLPGFGPDFAVFNAVEDVFAAEVAGHDQDRVLEVHGAALAVRNAAVVQDLQQDVENIGMRLFHFVEQDDTIGMAADGLGQLAAFVVADISGRRADQTGDAEFLHVFGHIDPDHVLLIVKERLGEGFGQFGLADAGGAQEQEGAQRPVRILDARAGAQDGLGNLLYGFVLPDDPAVQLILKMQQLLPLALHQAGDGDAGPAADDPGDFLLGDPVAQEAVFAAAFLGDGLLLLELLLQLRKLAVLQFGGAVQVVGTFGLLDLGVDALDFLAEAGDFSDGFLLRLPAGLHRTEGIPLLGQLALHLVQMHL